MVFSVSGTAGTIFSRGFSTFSTGFSGAVSFFRPSLPMLGPLPQINSAGSSISAGRFGISGSLMAMSKFFAISSKEARGTTGGFCSSWLSRTRTSGFADKASVLSRAGTACPGTCRAACMPFASIGAGTAASPAISGISSLGAIGFSLAASLAKLGIFSATSRPCRKSARIPTSRGVHSMPTMRNLLSSPFCQ